MSELRIGTESNDLAYSIESSEIEDIIRNGLIVITKDKKRSIRINDLTGERENAPQWIIEKESDRQIDKVDDMPARPVCHEHERAFVRDVAVPDIRKIQEDNVIARLNAIKKTKHILAQVTKAVHFPCHFGDFVHVGPDSAVKEITIGESERPKDGSGGGIVVIALDDNLGRVVAIEGTDHVLM